MSRLANESKRDQLTKLLTVFDSYDGEAAALAGAELVPHVAKGRTIRRSSVPVRSHGGVGFEPHRVVHGAPQLLRAAEIAFRRLNRDMPEEKLDLIEFAACEVTETGAGAPEVVRG